ncbi:Type 1 glutamine amidotransferase-like domain-containing protein [Lederbergia lenta]|uniref:Cyanophycinase n=1 Tax=Lederbergia lenta TaxID=1467 RepID=A0A2X4WMA9_LEDLE|nr:Type 1 glutamine amidotransferase-like domain-containing protein [Lederbergia lenta]MCM3109588.1 Type 1 glutamine amidotransferase-like domain-containing protein [Lederbergia lenta]MEC2324657.1 Type 1 glutamine amidotransferase-like domain-containing protein [Lederbergia lenta]SQI58740.1 Cyanophycinase [Lederbergia lenta]
MDKHLFLFGGGPPFTLNMAKQFVKLSLKMNGPVSILFVERDGWEQYMPRYTQALVDLGLNEFHYLPLPSTPIEKVKTCLKNSSGIIIGGGNTNFYADYIVETSISDSIIESYELGIPIAGFSAGALISPEHCIISPKDNEETEFQCRKGLGLISNVLIAVHFTQWNDEIHLRQAVSKFSQHINYGIDEDACIYFLNAYLEVMEGNGIYSLEHGILQRLN